MTDTDTDTSMLEQARTFYDAIAADYLDMARTELDDQPLSRAMLVAFADYAREAGSGPVLEVGCGPGRIAAYLSELGLSASGIDISPAMVALARREHPGLRFDVGSMTTLDIPDGTLSGVVAWYSIIHLPPESVPHAFAEFHRVLAPGGRLLLAFQVGDEPLRVERPFGHEVSLDFQRLRPERVAGAMRDAGFAMTAELVREPTGREKVPQACLLASRS